ncbi:MAG: flagellar protein FlaG [Selenomonadaceae bacterium]|nr:flagellar protein FlaG [Selenomonadaceae bacterium]
MGKLQDVLTAAVVIGSADHVKSGSKVPSRDSAIGVQNQVIINGTPKVNKPADELDEMFERDDIYAQDEDRLDPGTLDEKTVALMTEAFNELMSRINCNLEFQYHKEVNLMSIKMVDKRTNEVIKEVPPEEMIENMVRAKDWLGAFIDKNM